MPSKGHYIINEVRYSKTELNELCSKYLNISACTGKKEIQENLTSRCEELGFPSNFLWIELSKFILTGKRRRTLNSEELAFALKRPDFNKICELNDSGRILSEKNLKCHNTPAIKKVRKCLIKLKIPYRPEFPVVIDKSKSQNGDSKLYILDFYIPYPFNFIIEVDGGYHNTPEQKEYDRQRDMSTAGKGMGKTVRITNDQVLSNDFDLIKEFKRRKIKHFL